MSTKNYNKSPGVGWAPETTPVFNRTIIRDTGRGFINPVYKVERIIKGKISSVERKAYMYSPDDSGNADYFLSIYGDFVRYNTDQHYWMYWTGRVWSIDTEGHVKKWAEDAMKSFRTAIKENVPDSKEFAALRSHGKSCCNLREINNLLKMAEARVPIKSSEMDTTSHLFNVQNGTVDLRNGSIMRHNPNNYITKISPYNYVRNAESETFNKFLKTTFCDNKALRKYFQTVFGYCATGETREQLMFFAFGDGCNGKSTLLTAVMNVLGDYAALMPVQEISGKSSGAPGKASPEIAKLRAVRFVSCSEWSKSEQLNESKVKQLTGETEISARPLYGRPFNFAPAFKIMLDTNYLPGIEGEDHGIWRRIQVLPFDARISKKDIDKNLHAKLKADAEAILAWIINGAIRYYSKGLKPPKCVSKAKHQYRAKCDTIWGFLKTSVTKGHYDCQAQKLYNAYVEYCSQNSYTPCSNTTFGKNYRRWDMIKNGKASI